VNRSAAFDDIGMVVVVGDLHGSSIIPGGGVAMKRSWHSRGTLL
jgi:hypothetical protein